MRGSINFILPNGSRRRKAAKKMYNSLKDRQFIAVNSADITYDQWIKQCEPSIWSTTNRAHEGPLISIVVPCYNTPDKYLVPLVESVVGQVYQNWQLCLADGSTELDARQRIASLTKRDKRITYVSIRDNQGIVMNTNEGLKKATGEYVTFLDHDDVFSLYALNEVAKVISEDPTVDLLYSDEDKLSDDGRERLIPFFKPDWSPELLLGVNYINHLLVVRRTMIDKVGGMRTGFDGAQDFDLLLRLTENTNNIKHIPKILYHWRLAEGSTAKTVKEKNYADRAGQRALKDAVKRRGILADVIEIPNRPTNYRLRFRLPEHQPKVSIIIPFKDKPDLLRQCVGSILAKTSYKNYEIILISNNSVEQETHLYLDQLRQEKHCKIYTWDHPFNYSKINNFGRTQANGTFLVLLNNDTEIITDSWLEELIGVASQPATGAVGSLLYYPNKTIQHAGVILGMKTMAGHVFRRRQPNDWTDFGLPSWPRNYLAVTGACLAIKTSKYDEAGGLDEVFTVAGSDVALGISLFKKGYRNVYWPFVELIHYESASVGTYNNGIQLDYDHSLDYYRPYLNWHDPYFNSNLDLMNEQIGLRSRYE
ncbi:MAG TPA: glycosyltransferase [Candidatus Saccharimonadales bacterium]|nr:glycosyltransferase [Candidatus Saccharimonadales bacterium]